MAPNGSMPAVNIAGVNTMFVADPQRRKREEQQQQYMQQQQQQQQTQPNSGSNRRVRIASRSLSSDNELDSWASCLEEASTEKGAQFSAEDDGAAPKHKRTRVSQQVRQRIFLKIAPIFLFIFSSFIISLQNGAGGVRPKPRFDLESGPHSILLGEPFAGDDSSDAAYHVQSARGIAAVLNQGLQTLGEKLGGLSNTYTLSPLRRYMSKLFVPRTRNTACSLLNENVMH